MKNNHLLTFEYDPKNNQLEIHADGGGLRCLVEVLNGLLQRNEDDHEHLRISEWGGEELSGEKQCDENQLIPHVKIFRWNSDCG